MIPRTKYEKSKNEAKDPSLGIAKKKKIIQEPCIFVCVEDREKIEGEGSTKEVAVVTLYVGERRGWWREHTLVRDEMTQVFVRGECPAICSRYQFLRRI